MLLCRWCSQRLLPLQSLHLVLAETAATAVCTCSPSPLVLTDAATTEIFATVPLPLVLANNAVAAVFTLAPAPLVLATGIGLVGLLGYRRMWHRIYG